MLNIEDISISDYKFKKNAINIFVFGYENRSVYIYKEYFLNQNNNNQLFFIIKTKPVDKQVEKMIDMLVKKEKQIKSVQYNDYEIVKKEIISFVKKKQLSSNEPMEINIDYSSMPRTWYCNILFDLKHILKPKDLLNYWYSEGEYPLPHNKFPTAGIENYEIFSGRPSLSVEKKYYHLFGLGFDNVRTNAILSVVDPTDLISLFVCGTNNIVRLSEIKQRNENILVRSIMSLALPLESFNSILSKIIGLIYELKNHGDVVLIPDGPKPLILAMSIIPKILNEVGIVSLHVSRNIDAFSEVKVIANGNVHGFQVKC